MTLKISLVNPFLDAWQSLCFAHKVENKSCLYSTLYFSVLVNENVFFKAAGSTLSSNELNPA